MRKIISINLGWLLLLPLLHSNAAGGSHQDKTRLGGNKPLLKLSESNKITLGEIEDVVLVPWDISFPARIDTGAAISSLDARNVVVRGNIAEFKLGNRYGDLNVQLPFAEWLYIRTSMGIEKRPVVEMTICLGPKLFRTLATLRDRSRMKYPFLIGRHALNGSFLVDTSRSRIASPMCSADTLASQDVKTTVLH